MKQSKFGISMFCLSISLVVVTAIGCALFKPTPQGTCPTLTVDLFGGSAFAGGYAALKGGCPPATLTAIASNITATIATGQFNGDLVKIAIANAGASQWTAALGGIDVLFGQQFNSMVATGVNAQVCSVPCAQAVAVGLNTAVLMAPSNKAKAIRQEDALAILRQKLAALKQ